MRLQHRIRRLEDSARRERQFWVIHLPSTPIKRLRYIDRKIRTGDVLIIFDLRDRTKRDAKVNDLLDSIRTRRHPSGVTNN